MSSRKTGTVLKVGVVGVGEYSPTINHDAYDAWSNMLYRCYGNSVLNKSYDKCYVCEEWLDFQNFAQYYYDDEYRQSGWQLDKDILHKDNHEYSPQHCVFTPPKINKVFVKRKRHRGVLPIGVHFESQRNKYKASLHDGTGKTKFLGRYLSSYEAFAAYKAAKEAIIKNLAEDFKPAISPKLYNAMVKYEVKIDD